MADNLNKLAPGQFLDVFLSNPKTSIPKGAQWAIVFNDLPGIKDAIKQAYEREPGDGNKWTTLKSAEALTSSAFQTTHGCLFCQAIGLPGESMTANPEGNIVSNAFIRSYVGAGRNAFPIMRMTFLDTQVSFADSFLRGWALATANFGLLARTDVTYRTDLTCYKFAITPDGPQIIQSMSFNGICCISVGDEEYQYTPATSPILREAQFIYNSYSVNTDLGNKLPNKGVTQLAP